MRWVTAARTSIDTPQRFTARYPGRCAACGRRFEAGMPVAGIRPVGRRWTLWHDTIECWQKAHPETLGSVPKGSPVRSSVDDELLEEYDRALSP